MTIKLIVGLGNPGNKYEHTRHNAGFWFVEEIAKKTSINWQNKAKFHGEYAKLIVNNTEVHLLKPQTFMNLSGLSVAMLVSFYNIRIDEVLIVHDELDLQTGTIKLKQGGGHGGHNGLRDIEKHLYSREYLRLRIGIGHPGHASLVSNYVLKAPSIDEKIDIQRSIDKAMFNLDSIIEGNIQNAMNILHS